MATIQEKKEALSNKLQEMCIEKASGEGLFIQSPRNGVLNLTTSYDEKVFGFAAGKFIMRKKVLFLVLGIGDGCPLAENSLWVLREGDDDVKFLGHKRAADLEAQGYVLVA